MRLQQAATGGPDAQSLVKMVVMVDAPTGSSAVLNSQLPRMPFFSFASLTTPDRLIGGKVVGVKTDFAGQTTDVSLQFHV